MKMFLSVLGTSDYVHCRYQPKGEDPGPVVKYVQEDLLRRYCKDWTPADQVVMFLTADARKRNWEDGAYKEGCTGELNTGLHSVIKEMQKNGQLQAQLQVYPLGDGHSAADVSDMFMTFFEALQTGAGAGGEEVEIYLDITHSFRHMPMLLTVLMNYAGLLLNIKVAGVYYGAFEKLGFAGSVRTAIPEPQQRIAPVVDMNFLIELQQWTLAVHDQLNNGRSERLRQLGQQYYSPRLRESKGGDQEAQLIKTVTEEVDKLTSIVEMCRGPQSVDFDSEILVQAVEGLEEACSLKPLVPLLDKLKERYSNYAKSNLHNLFSAVQLALDNRLYQQAVTLLQEGLITNWLEMLGFNEADILDDTVRENVNRAAKAVEKIHCEKTIRPQFGFQPDESFSGMNPDEKWNRFAESFNPETLQLLQNNTDWQPGSWDLEKYTELLKNFLFLQLWPEYQELTAIRNDFNHGGFNNQAIDSTKLKKRVINAVEEVIRLSRGW